MIPSQHKVKNKLHFWQEKDNKNTPLEFFNYLQITSQHMYILFDKTTHYATQCTLIILSDHLLRSKNIYIYLTNAVQRQ